MNRVDAVWSVGRVTIGSVVRLLTPLRNYGVGPRAAHRRRRLRVQPLPLDRPARLRATPRHARCTSSPRSRPIACPGSDS